MAVDLKREAPSGNSAFSRRERKGGEEVRGLEVVKVQDAATHTYAHTIYLGNELWGC